MHMATKIKRWTLAELHRLPEDGNKYELVRGELFVTPAPSVDHETILARLTRLLEPYVSRHDLGYVYHPRAVMRFEGSEVEPDLMVRKGPTRKKTRWESAPRPILVVEVFSPYTRRRDLVKKRSLYVDAEIAEYWMIDPEEEWVAVARPGRDDESVRDALSWKPLATAEPLVISLPELFTP